MEYAVLRLVHLGFGILWASGALVSGFWLLPAAVEAGPAGDAVMRGVMGRRFPQIMTISGLLAVLAGVRLYQLRFTTEWVTTPEGLTLTLGGLLGIAALIIGLVAQRPAAMRLGALGAQIAASGGPPTAEQAAELAALKAKLLRVGRVLAWHMAAAVLLMASMRLATAL